MESHCCCQVRAAFYLLQAANVKFLFLSTAAALFHARSEDAISFGMEFA